MDLVLFSDNTIIMGEPTEGTPPIISVSTMAWQGYDLETALREIAAIGFRWVEPAFIMGFTENLTEDAFSKANARNLIRRMDENGLRASSLAAHMDLGQADSLDAFKQRMDFARTIGARTIISTASTAQNRQAFLGNIEKLAQYAKSRNLVIALENPGEGRDNLIPDGRAGIRLIREIGSPRVRLNYDFANAYSYAGGRLQPEDELSEVLPWAAHFHLKDMAPDPDGFAFTAIGRGLMPYGRMLPRLAAAEPPPPLCLEIPLKLRRDPQHQPLRIDEPLPLDAIRKILAESFEFVKGHIE